MDLEQLTKRLREFTKGRHDITTIYLFNTQDSIDVNLAILMSDEGSRAFEISEEINALIQGDNTDDRKIKLHILNKMPLQSQFNITAQRKILCSTNEDYRVDWEVNMLTEYYDMQEFHESWEQIKREVK